MGIHNRTFHLIHRIWRVSAPEEGANLLSSFFSNGMSSFDPVAQQRVQKNLPSRVIHYKRHDQTL